MTNLIVTPYWRAQDELNKMMEAIDKFSTMPFHHVVVGDNDKPKGKTTANRTFLVNNYEEDPATHTNQEGKAIQMGMRWAANNLEEPDYVFLIENDVMVKEDWDKKMLEEINNLPEDWATLDVTSLEPFEDGFKIGYPTVVNVPIGQENEFAILNYTDFQCTLFNPEVWTLSWSFDMVPSHFDILISRRITELSGRRHFRTPRVEVIHYPSSSRKFLPKQ